MSRLKVLLAALSAVLIASACASAVASAEESLPYLSSSSFPIKYSGTISETARWEGSEGNSFKCEGKSTSEGEITGTKTLTAVMRFQGCRVTGVNSWCTSEGAAQGEIVTQPLEGTLVMPPEWWAGFGVVFRPKSGENVVNTFHCLTVNSVVRGAVIVMSSTPRNKATSTLALPFKEASGVQNPNYYYPNPETTEEKVFASLETTWASGVFHPIGWSFNETLNLSGTVTPKYL